MKKNTTLLLLLLFLSFTTSLAQVTTPRPTARPEGTLDPSRREGQGGGSEVITEEKGITIVNTTALAEDFEGYAGPTPLKIYIKNKKIEKIEAIKNLETPKYFALIKRDLLNKWNGLTVKKAAQTQVDVITGATLSSEAVIENVKRGIEYYNKNAK